MAKKKFDSNDKAVLRRRGLNPDDYEFVKETYCALYIRNKLTGIIKILNKSN